MLSQATQPDETFRRFESEENDPTYLEKNQHWKICKAEKNYVKCHKMRWALPGLDKLGLRASYDIAQGPCELMSARESQSESE